MATGARDLGRCVVRPTAAAAPQTRHTVSSVALADQQTQSCAPQLQAAPSLTLLLQLPFARLADVHRLRHSARPTATCHAPVRCIHQQQVDIWPTAAPAALLRCCCGGAARVRLQITLPACSSGYRGECCRSSNLPGPSHHSCCPSCRHGAGRTVCAAACTASLVGICANCCPSCRPRPCHSTR